MGRTGFEEKKVDFNDTIRTLEYITQSEIVSGEMDFHHFRPGTFSNPDQKLIKYFDKPVTPIAAKEFFSKYFRKPSLLPDNFTPYFIGNHQVYYGRKEEVHYIDVGSGVTNSSNKKLLGVLKRKPKRKVIKESKMRFVVRKKQ